MTLGFSNAAQRMRRLMETVIPAALRDHAFIYIDNLLVFIPVIRRVNRYTKFVEKYVTDRKRYNVKSKYSRPESTAESIWLEISGTIKLGLWKSLTVRIFVRADASSSYDITQIFSLTIAKLHFFNIYCKFGVAVLFWVQFYSSIMRITCFPTFAHLRYILTNSHNTVETIVINTHYSEKIFVQSRSDFTYNTDKDRT